MKYTDYYASLGVDRGADAAEIKKAYRQLARRYHPDVSKEADAEEKFKQVAEAYRTLKNPELKAAYDALGRRAAGTEFEPGQDWQQEFSQGGFTADDFDLADLFASLRGHAGQRHGGGPRAAAPGQDFEVKVSLSVEDAFAGRELPLELMLPEYDAEGRMQRRPTTVRARIPAGATEGQRLRVRGKGGAGSAGGPAGDLYLTIGLDAHPVFRVSGHDIFIDLPLAPWEAVLGASVGVPTPAGKVRLKIPPGTQGGQQLRLPGRGFPRRQKDPGDLFALVQIVFPRDPGEPERALYQQLAELSHFEPRAAWPDQGEHS